jgi:TonB-linked SusC/RagA family outer membrane protein
MKINDFIKESSLVRFLIPKIKFKIPDCMKVCIILNLVLTLSLQNLQAMVISPKSTFTFKKENLSVLDVIKIIEENSSYRFFYNEDLIDLNRRVNINVENASIDKVLMVLFDNSGIGYEVMNNNVIAIAPLRKAYNKESGLKGVVKDVSTGESLPGVSILIEGTNQGTVTDTSGAFSFENIEENTILTLSYVGYLKKSVVVGKDRNLVIYLEVDVQKIDEVVVIGYGVAKKSDLTGAISYIKSEDINTAAGANLTQMIQGKLSGVTITQESSQPGGGLKILVRGQASTNADNQPLYVIDGFPINNDQIETNDGILGIMKYSSGSRNPLNSINPNDIESIEVLKDASSTAIYGARAANGVVLITTKSGKNGISVNYDGKYSFQKITRYEEMMNAEEFMRYYDIQREMFIRATRGIYPFGSQPAEGFVYKPTFSEEQISQAGDGTNWFDQITQPGSISDHNLSVSGGKDNTRIFSSVNYFNQKGVVINSGLQRVSGRVNIDQKISDKLDFGIRMAGSQIKNNNAALGSGYWEQVGVIGSALGFPPIYPVYDSLGEYSENKYYSNNPNPVSFNEIEDNTLEKRWLTTMFSEIKPLKGLTIRPSIGFDNFTSDRTQYLPSTFKFGASVHGRATRGYNTAATYLFETTVNYIKSIKGHNFAGMGGYSYQKVIKDGFSSYATNFFTDAFGANSLQSGSSIPLVSSYKNQTVLASYFARINYNYKGRYLLTFTGRLDGSDRFGENNKYGFFPSLALGWNAAKETFMSNQKLFDLLKLRLSAGQTGNSNIGGNAFAYYGTSINGSGTSFQFDDVIYTGMGKTQQENPNLKWETTTEYNIGLDFGLWRGRVSGSIELFQKYVSDLLYQQILQIYQQVNSIYMNVGKTQSRGFEFYLNANIISTSTFNWSINLNGSQYKDRWVDRAPESIPNLDDNLALQDYLRPVYYWKPDHIFQIGETQPYTNVNYLPGCLVTKDLDSWTINEQGDYVYDSNGRRIKTGNPDGRIDDADKAFLGTRDPQFVYGFGSNLTFKNFDLTIFFNGMLNYWIEDENFNFNVLRTEDIFGGFNKSKRFKDTWTVYNQDGKIPLSIKNFIPQEVGADALKFKKISYLRLKNITIGYNIPKKVLGTSIRVYFDGSNLLTFSNLEYMDPETILWQDKSQYSSSASGLYSYPSYKSYTLGVSVKF